MKKVILVIVILVLCMSGMHYHNCKVEKERKLQDLQWQLQATKSINKEKFGK